MYLWEGVSGLVQEKKKQARDFKRVQFGYDYHLRSLNLTTLSTAFVSAMNVLLLSTLSIIYGTQSEIGNDAAYMKSCDQPFLLTSHQIHLLAPHLTCIMNQSKACNLRAAQNFKASPQLNDLKPNEMRRSAISLLALVPGFCQHCSSYAILFLRFA